MWMVFNTSNKAKIIIFVRVFMFFVEINSANALTLFENVLLKFFYQTDEKSKVSLSNTIKNFIFFINQNTKLFIPSFVVLVMNNVCIILKQTFVLIQIKITWIFFDPIYCFDECFPVKGEFKLDAIFYNM